MEESKMPKWGMWIGLFILALAVLIFLSVGTAGTAESYRMPPDVYEVTEKEIERVKPENNEEDIE